MPADLDLQRRRGELFEGFSIDVGNQVAEPIDPLDLAVDSPGIEYRVRQLQAMDVSGGTPECGQLDPFGKPGGGGGETIAPLERAADGRPRVAAFGQFD